MKYRVTFKATGKSLYIALVEAESTRDAIKSATSWQHIESPGAKFLKAEESK